MTTELSATLPMAKAMRKMTMLNRTMTRHNATLYAAADRPAYNAWLIREWLAIWQGTFTLDDHTSPLNIAVKAICRINVTTTASPIDGYHQLINAVQQLNHALFAYTAEMDADVNKSHISELLTLYAAYLTSCMQHGQLALRLTTLIAIASPGSFEYIAVTQLREAIISAERHNQRRNASVATVRPYALWVHALVDGLYQTHGLANTSRNFNMAYLAVADMKKEEDKHHGSTRFKRKLSAALELLLIGEPVSPVNIWTNQTAQRIAAIYCQYVAQAITANEPVLRINNLLSLDYSQRAIFVRKTFVAKHF